MSHNLIQYAFVAGEISKTFFGRTDLEKYDLGVELAKNWFVDYRGGLSTRPGTWFHDFIQHDDKEVKLIPFRYSQDDANTYSILVGHLYFRFVQNGAYVLEEEKVISSVSAAEPGVVTSAAHGFVAGNWVKIAGRTFEVGAVTTDTFELLSPFGEDFDTTGVEAILTATAVARIYTVVTPYITAHVQDLRFYQSLNDVHITHNSYTPAILSRNDHDDWVLEEVDFENSVESPSSPNAFTSGGSGNTMGTTYAITAVDIDGKESLPAYGADIGLTPFDTAGDSISFTWDASPDAVNYNVYRGLMVGQGTMTSGQQVGFIGQSRGLSFVDNNILPDFTITPPQGYNPFANGAIERIVVTDGGSNYSLGTTVTITDPDGSGFIGFPVINKNNSSGYIEGVIIIEAGSGYTAPVVVFTDGAGGGAEATAELTEASGNNPALFTVCQQRGVYLSTPNNPMSLWGSQPGTFYDFSYSEIVVEDDSYEFTIDAQELAPIKHAFATRGGLLIMTQSGVWLMTGGSETAISPINALADPQIYKGVSDVIPLPIDADILYVESKGSSVRMLSYNDYAKVYSGISMSILANHLFSSEKFITKWTFAESPSSVVWSVRNDGAILPFTYVNEQKVYAWTQAWTKGFFREALAVQEGITDVTYLIVERKIAGRWSKFIESFATKDFLSVEDACCLDSSLSLSPSYPDGVLVLSGTSGTITINCPSTIFSPSDTGKVWRGGGGKGIATYVTNKQITVALSRPVTSVIPETDVAVNLEPGEWTLDTPVTTLSGLWHLEGQTVKVLGDGNVMGEFVVANGAITLPYAVTRAIVGLGFQCVARNLPMTARDAIIEDKRKRIVGLGVRKHDTRGLKIGTSLSHLYPMKEIVSVSGDPIPLRSSQDYILVNSDWDENGQSYFVQDDPLPATILGLVQDFEVGDDQD